MPQLVRIRALALATALLAVCAPASLATSTGGAAVAPPQTVDGATAGGAAPGALAPAPRRAAVRTRRATRRHARRAGGARPHRRARARRTPTPVAPPGLATLLADGTAAPPSGAPLAVAAAIAAGNRIASLPYRWGGGHARWHDRGYDCSGSVGYALHGAGLLDASATSGELMSYGEPGPGTWITIYANRTHVYMTVAGLRFDTSGADPSRWQPDMRSAHGFRVRHPAGF